MYKANNFQDLTDKVIESAYKWAKEDSLKDGKDIITDNFCKLSVDFNTLIRMKYGSAHVAEETLRNRYAEVFYILGEVNKKDLLEDQLCQLNFALLDFAGAILKSDDEKDNVIEANDDEI